MVIFKSKQWSYKDLPYRIHDQGMLHRNESSGSIGGLTRTRCFCQDDAHIFSTPEALGQEITTILKMVQSVYGKFGMEVRATLSTRPTKFMGETKEWDHAEQVLKEQLVMAAIPHGVAAGEGAFYGPKIDFVVKDSLGREWQTATVQLDFQLPQRFELTYKNQQDQNCTPIVIHRAIYGSFERFFGIMLEHTQGALPFWLAPTQVAVLTINDRNLLAAQKVKDVLARNGIRVEINDSNNTLSQKVAVTIEKEIPIMAIVGDKEEASGQVSIRTKERNSGSVQPLLFFVDDMVAMNKFSF